MPKFAYITEKMFYRVGSNLLKTLNFSIDLSFITLFFVFLREKREMILFDFVSSSTQFGKISPLDSLHSGKGLRSMQMTAVEVL